MTGSDCRAGKIANAKPGSRNDAEDHGHEGHNRDRFDANFLEANAISIGVQADAACMKKSGDHGNACGDSEWEYCVAEEVHSDVLTHGVSRDQPFPSISGELAASPKHVFHPLNPENGDELWII